MDKEDIICGIIVYSLLFIGISYMCASANRNYNRYYNRPKIIWIQNPYCREGDYCFNHYCVHKTVNGFCNSKGYESIDQEMCVRKPDWGNSACK